MDKIQKETSQDLTLTRQYILYRSCIPSAVSGPGCSFIHQGCACSQDICLTLHDSVMFWYPISIALYFRLQSVKSPLCVPETPCHASICDNLLCSPIAVCYSFLILLYDTLTVIPIGYGHCKFSGAAHEIQNAVQTLAGPCQNTTSALTEISGKPFPL